MGQLESLAMVGVICAPILLSGLVVWAISAQARGVEKELDDIDRIFKRIEERDAKAIRGWGEKDGESTEK